MSTMLAARLAEGADLFSFEQVAIPAIGSQDVLVRVRACGICGSDLHVIDGITPTSYRPITLGHEPAGIVAETGDEVRGFGRGDRVFVNPLLVCGACRYCRGGRPHICLRRRVLGIHRDGALAEYVSVPAANLMKLAPDMDFELAAIIESAATPYHALTARAPVKPGDAVAVIGVGGLGVHGVQIARILGAAPIIAVDVDDRALRRALELGASHAVDPRGQDVVRAVRSVSGGGVDVALECVGRADTCTWAVEILRPGGIAALAGIGPVGAQLPPTTIFARSEIEVRGVYMYGPAELERVAELIATGRLDARAAISAVYTLDRANDALERFRSKDAATVRVLVTP